MKILKFKLKVLSIMYTHMYFPLKNINWFEKIYIRILLLNIISKTILMKIQLHDIQMDNIIIIKIFHILKLYLIFLKN
jgi:hypothetical protein